MGAELHVLHGRDAAHVRGPADTREKRKISHRLSWGRG